MKKIWYRLQSYNFKSYSLVIVVAAIILGGIGAATLYLMPGVLDESLYIKQILGVAFGVALCVFVSLFDYRFIAKCWIILYIINILLLLAVKFTKFGINRYGATRWLGLTSGDKIIVSFQPSEITKLALIIALAKIYFMLKERAEKWYTIFIVGIVFAIPTFLVLKQPDLSTSIVLVSLFIVMLFASGYNIKIFSGCALFAIPTAIVGFWYVQQPGCKIITETQQKRILSWLHPEDYPAEMYQQLNSMASIRSGGLLGKTLTGDTGPRLSTTVPVVESDFIFAGIGEEFGFLGAIVMVGLYLLLTFYIVRIGYKAVDKLGKLIAIGCATIFMSQAFVNIGVVTSLLPNTGIPLPFVSSGLSSVFSSYVMLGMVENIAINHVTEIKEESEDYLG